MDQHGLAVDARRHEDRAARVDHPELVPVVRAGGELDGVGSGRERRHGLGIGGQRVVDPRTGDHLLAAAPPASQQEQPEPRQIPEGAADAAVGHRVAVAVDGHLGVGLRTHRSPELVRDQIGEPSAGSTFHHPRQQVGEDRSVVEPSPVRTFVLERGVVGGDVGRQVEVHPRSPQVDLLVDADIGVEVRVVLVEPRPGPHVQQMPDRAPVPRRAGELGQVCGHWIVGRQKSPTDEPPGHGRRDRLGDRHDQMPRPSRHAVEVGLHNDASAVQDDDAVGVGALEEGGERHPPSVGVDRRCREVAGILR